jgi:nucleotide-binding universal stress UspA family protein
VLDAVLPDGLVAGPPPGQWRAARQRSRAGDSLFADILVALDGRESGWQALDWAFEMALREQAAVHALHVSPTGSEAGKEDTQAVQAEFERRCSLAGISGVWTIESGKIPRLLCERARWMDLVVLSLSHPYASDPRARLESGLRTIIRRCPTPVVVVPRATEGLQRALLAYDGSPKAREALFVATYLASRWGVSLTVLTVTESDDAAQEVLDDARAYLSDHQVQATLLHERGPVAATILVSAEEQATDLILLGGYGDTPVAELALGSAVEEVLRSSVWPVLVCQ